MQTDALRSIEHSIAQKRDAALVKSTLAGDSTSFAKLVGLYTRRIAAFGMRFFRNAADTDDFVQDVFIKAYRSLSTFRGEAAFSTWLMRIAYNLAVNAVTRAKELLPLVDEQILSAPGYTPEEQEIRRLTARAITEAVRELPEKYGICMELYFYCDCAYEEIAVITGYPVNTIKSHIFRAKKLLRDKLRGYYEN